MSKYEKIFGKGWYTKLKPFLESEEFKKIGRFLKERQNEGIKMYPMFDDVFRAFSECPYEDLTVVVLTNNAYNKETDGIAFSARECEDAGDVPKPLREIFDAVETDCADGLYLDRDPDLTRWARQGVLLLNCDLTTEHNKAGSHIKLWKPFIQYVLKTLREYNNGMIYFCVGKEAQKYIVEEPTIAVLLNDVYSVEHPMQAVIKKRPWKHKEMFSTINRVSKFLNEKEIKWT